MYRCICGKEYLKPNAFNGHKSHCETHLKSVGRYEAYQNSKLNSSKKKSKTLKGKLLVERERRVCVCNTVFETTPSSKRRFCSVSCANRYRGISNNFLEGAARYRKNYLTNRKKEYRQNPKTCDICGKILKYDRRYNKTCSVECGYKSNSAVQKGTKRYYSSGENIIGRHIVYKTTCIINNKFYIGVRKTTADFDGYLGSGVIIKRMVRKYGSDNFNRDTLYVTNSSKDAYNKEIELLKLYSKDVNCVNISPGGRGGWVKRGL